MGEAARRRRETSDSCENCVFWDKYVNRADAGECHAAPPYAIPVGMAPPALQGQQAQPIYQGVWPPTLATRWCGAHRRSLLGNAMQIDFSNLSPIEGDKVR